jgi:phosphoglycolate phosphatase
VTVDNIRSVSGRPFPECVATLLPELSPVPPATLEHLEARERTGIELMAGVLYEGVAEGLSRLAERYPLFLVSNCPGWYLEAFFRAAGLQECFSGWDCHGLSGIPKSGMLLNLAATQRLAHAVYVGDTRGDQESAEMAGMEFAFVTYGFGRAEGAPLSFAGFGELVSHYLARPIPPRSPRSRSSTPARPGG